MYYLFELIAGHLAVDKGVVQECAQVAMNVRCKEPRSLKAAGNGLRHEKDNCRHKLLLDNRPQLDWSRLLCPVPE